MSKEIKVSDVYPITTITYPDGETFRVVMDHHLKEYTAPIKYRELEDFLLGQTRIFEGVYVSDVEDWLNGKPNLD